MNYFDNVNMEIYDSNKTVIYKIVHPSYSMMNVSLIVLRKMIKMFVLCLNYLVTSMII